MHITPGGYKSTSARSPCEEARTINKKKKILPAINQPRGAAAAAAADFLVPFLPARGGKAGGSRLGGTGVKAGVTTPMDNKSWETRAAFKC